MNLKILAFGEVLWDIIEGESYIGGAPLNFCGHCNCLGDNTSIISAVGQDELGINTRQVLRNLNISDHYLSSVDAPTGTVPVSLVNGIPSYDIKTGSAWDAIELNNGLFEEVINTDWDLLYMGTLAQRSSGNAALLDKLFNAPIKVKHIFFDINIRKNYYSEEIILKSLERANIVKFNDDELILIKDLFGKNSLDDIIFIQDLMSKFNIEYFCVTRGKEGADLYYGIEKQSFAPKNISVVSTVGAGDSFSAGLVHGLISTGSIETAGTLAVLVSDFVVSHKGALPEYSDKILREIRNIN